MILGLGSDLIDIRRIEQTIARFGDRFLDRIFTEAERRRCDRARQSAPPATPAASPPRRLRPRRSAPGFAAASSGAISGSSTCRAGSRACS